MLVFPCVDGFETIARLVDSSRKEERHGVWVDGDGDGDEEGDGDDDGDGLVVVGLSLVIWGG